MRTNPESRHKILLVVGLVLALVAVVLWLDAMDIASRAASLEGGHVAGQTNLTVGGLEASSAMRSLWARLFGGLAVAVLLVLWKLRRSRIDRDPR